MGTGLRVPLRTKEYVFNRDHNLLEQNHRSHLPQVQAGVFSQKVESEVEERQAMDKDARFITWVIIICAMLVFGWWYGRKDWDCKFRHGPKLRELEQRIEKLEKAYEATKDLSIR